MKKIITTPLGQMVSLGILFAMELVLLHFTPCNTIHGRSDAAIIVGIFGVIALVISYLFKLKTLTFVATFGYIFALILGVIFQTDGVDYGGGATNSLWKIWLISYWVLLAIGFALSCILKKKQQKSYNWGYVYAKTKQKIVCISVAVIAMVWIASLFANYYDTARVSTGHKPKFVIETYSEKHEAVIYWGLGYKVVRYVSVSPNEPYENSIEVKMGSWFMPYGKTEYSDIFVESMETGTTTEVQLYRDVAALSNFLTNQKYIHGVCEGIPAYKITVDEDVYYVKSDCNGISFAGHDAHLSNEDMEYLIQLLNK